MAANEKYLTDNNVFFCNSATTGTELEDNYNAGKVLVYDGTMPSSSYFLRAPLTSYEDGYYCFVGWNTDLNRLCIVYRRYDSAWAGTFITNGLPLFYNMRVNTLPYTTHGAPYFPSNNAVYNYTTTQAGMPHSIVYTDGKLIFSNGALLACADGSTTSAWTMDLATFYEYFMKSIGAYTGTTNPSAQDMYTTLYQRIHQYTKFVRLRSGSTNKARLWTNGLSHQMASAASFTSVSSGTALLKVYRYDAGATVEITIPATYT